MQSRLGLAGEGGQGAEGVVQDAGAGPRNVGIPGEGGWGPWKDAWNSHPKDPVWPPGQEGRSAVP